MRLRHVRLPESFLTVHAPALGDAIAMPVLRRRRTALADDSARKFACVAVPGAVDSILSF